MRTADCPSEPESDWAIGRVERDRCQAQSDLHMQAVISKSRRPSFTCLSGYPTNPALRVTIGGR